MLFRMNNDPLSPILNQLYPGARVHHGFLDQFQAVTDQAANASQNIRCAHTETFRTHSGCARNPWQVCMMLAASCVASKASAVLGAMQRMRSDSIRMLCMAP